MIAERSSRTDAKGHLHLMLQGPEGAVTLEAWHDGPVGDVGIVGIHSPAPLFSGQEARPCSVLGVCYSDIPHSDGQIAGQQLLAGDERGAWDILDYWYQSRLAPWASVW